MDSFLESEKNNRNDTPDTNSDPSPSKPKEPFHECQARQKLIDISKECDSLICYINVLQTLERDQLFTEGRKCVTVEFSFMVMNAHPEFAHEILYLLKLYLHKNYPKKPDSYFPLSCQIM